MSRVDADPQRADFGRAAKIEEIAICDRASEGPWNNFNRSVTSNDDDKG